MFKSREILYGAVFGTVVIGLSLLICMAVPFLGVYVVIGEGVVLLAAFFIFCVYRYRRIRELSEFLRKAQNQKPPLEVLDQREGELSVLKGELGKLLAKYYSQAELLKRDKKFLADTISDISHQLKTPMTSMNVMIDQLRDESLAHDKRVEFTNALHKQMSRMEWLLSAMLTMSRLDAGAIVLKRDTIKVRDLMHKASEHLLIPMELHGQKMVVEGDMSAIYQGDLHWSSEAISNILKNCMEYTPDNGVITVEMQCNSLCTDIRIKDQGGGISEKDSHHIFERFYKGENALTDSAGIGLALAKRLIDEQNGTIEIQTIYGESTVFIVRFYHHNI